MESFLLIMRVGRDCQARGTKVRFIHHREGQYPTRDMAEQGFMLVESGVAGQATRFAFLDTRAAIGTYIELVYLDEDNQALFERIRRGDF
jgi:hypothetical protein